MKFRRQAPIGPYVVDFLCADCCLIVELDGGQHAERTLYDEARTRDLNAHGYRVLRFWNNQVTENLDGVLMTIQAALKS